MLNYSTKKWAALLLFLFLGGCGGGGGGSADNSSTLNSETSLELVQLMNHVSEGALLNVKSALDVLGRFSITPQSDFACPDSGSVSVNHEDNDFSNTLSAGDSVLLVYNSCRDTLLGGFAQGSVEVELTGFARAFNSELRVTGKFTANDFQNRDYGTVSGSYDFGYQLSFEGETIIVTGGGDSLSFIRNEEAELSQFSISKETDININTGPFTYQGIPSGVEVSIAGRVKSDSLNSAFTCQSPTPFIAANTGGALRWKSGILNCTTGSNTVRLEVDPDKALNAIANVEIFLDNSSTGTAPSTIYTESFLFENTSKAEPTGALPEVASQKLVLPTYDVAYSESTGYVYLTIPSSSQQYPGSLVVMDLSTLNIVEAKSIAGEPKYLGISADGEILYIGLGDVSGIIKLPTADLSQTETISLDQPFGTPPFAADIAVSPVDNNTFATWLYRKNNGTPPRIGLGITLFEDGVQLPEKAGSRDRVEYSSDGMKLFGFNSQSTEYGFSILNINATGVSHDIYIYGFTYAFPFAPDIHYAGNNIYTTAGEVLDPDTGVIVGRFDNFIEPTPDRLGVAVDATAKRAYYWNYVFEVYDTDTYLPVASYFLDYQGTPKKLILAGPNRLVATTDEEIHVINRSAVADQDFNSCFSNTEAEFVSGNTALVVHCEFNDAVYDSSRNRIYASVTARTPGDGNSIAIIAPDTGTIEEYIRVGADPGKLALASDNSLLYIGLLKSPHMVILDLNTKQIISSTFLGYRFSNPTYSEGYELYNYPLYVDDIESPPLAPQSVVASLFRFLVPRFEEVALFNSGVKAPNVYDELNKYVNRIEFSDDPSIFYGIDNENDFDIRTFSWGPSGISLLNTIEQPTGSLNNDYKYFGGVFYTNLGSIVDPVTAATEFFPFTSIETSALVEPDPNGNHAYFYFDDVLAAHDPIIRRYSLPDMQHTGTIKLPRFRGLKGEPLALLDVGNNRLMALTKNKMFIVNKNSFN